MQGISAILNIAKGALQANSQATEVVSHNIANVNTPGYSRQAAVLEAEAPAEQGLIKLGLGVRVASVVQAFDRYTTQTINQNTSSLSAYDAKASVLSYVEQLFNEAAGTSLGQAMDEFWTAWQDVANNPGGDPERTALLEKADQLSDLFNFLSQELTQLGQNLNTNLSYALPEVNTLTGRIADLNGKILAAEASQTTANDLRDERNTLLEKLSAYMGITSLEDESGEVTVLTSQGILLVSGTQSMQLSQSGNSIYWNGIESDVSNRLVGGKIGGWLDLRDEILPQYRANLDELAGTLISNVNTLHAAGYTLDGATGMDFFTDFLTSPEVPNASDYQGAAAYISVSSDVRGNPRNIAAGGQNAGPGDNEKALEILALQTDATVQVRKWTYADRGNTVSSSLQTEPLNDYYQILVGEIAILTDDSNQNRDFTQTMLDRLGEIRDSVSGVNMDEELTDLMKFQRSYEAAAKLVSVADEMLQNILDLR
jgi:flagellar hook-associated protein 1 FlgK